MENETPQVVIGALLASGFPFQTAVARAIGQLKDWTVVAEEFPWRDELAGDQFLDLVVSDDHFVVSIECKKTQKETLTFLQPGNASVSEERFDFLRPGKAADGVVGARVLYLEQIQDSTRRMELFCADRFMSPASSQSSFCVVSTSSSGKDQRLLERDAQRLIRATDSYAWQYKRDFKVKSNSEYERLVLPVIVTNAKLFVAKYDAASVSLDTGQFEPVDAASVVPVDRVRFRKSFTSFGHRDYGNRTVFVVTASSLLAFLRELALTETSALGKAHFQVPE